MPCAVAMGQWAGPSCSSVTWPVFMAHVDCVCLLQGRHEEVAIFVGRIGYVFVRRIRGALACRLHRLLVRLHVRLYRLLVFRLCLCLAVCLSVTSVTCISVTAVTCFVFYRG